MTPTVHIHLMVSAKGGVGKTALSVAAAAGLAAWGRRVVLLDADFTGTSIADALDLTPPKLRSGPSGNLVLQAPTAGWLVEHEQARRLRQMSARGPVGMPFLNDAVLHRAAGLANECHLPSMAWQWQGSDIIMLPSSPLERDVGVALGWLAHRPEDWVPRFAALLRLLRLQIPDLTDIVIDLAPGIFGLTASVLECTELLPRTDAELGVTWRVVPVLVMTEDRHDLRVAAPAFAVLLDRFPHAIAVLNRATTSDTVIHERFRAAAGDQREWIPGDRLPRLVSRNDASLGRMFQEGGALDKVGVAQILWALRV
jgi:hypothetical protein